VRVSLLFVGIAIGLLIAGGAALVRLIVPGGRKGVGNHEALRVAVERTSREPWSVAFRDDAPLVPPLATLAAHSHVESYGTLREHGGVDFGETELRLTLGTHGEGAVVVRDISVHVVRRDPPFTGRLVGVGASGDTASGALVCDLDAGEPADAEQPLLAEAITVQPDEPVAVIVMGTTTSAYCQWRIHIDTEVGDEHRRITIGDRDLPFETTGCDRSEFANGLELLD
jgi:hypothetical protein